MKRVLLVEDHPAFRKALVLLLEREPGLKVMGQAGSYAEARELGLIEKGFDIAVLDVRLPDGDGLELIRELRATNPGIAILVLTITLDSGDIVRARRMGADEVLGKHTPLREIVAAVRRLAGVR
ncbi:MAG: response regulator transcription factor [Actinomycetota bacterium]